MDGLKPRLLPVDPAKPQPDVIATAAQVLRDGGLIVLPTDTVYGVAAAPGGEEKIYAAKSRDRAKPIPLLVAEAAEVSRRGGKMGWRARLLARRYWPGPLTLVLPAAGGGKEGFRIPNHEVTLAVIRAAGGALRVTSANQSGEAAARDAQSALAALAGHVELALDAGPSPLGRESTVVEEDGETLRVLRSGAISQAAILARPTLLFVCTGNICRSPMAEYLLKRWLGPDPKWDVKSAGVSAEDGAPASEAAVAALAEKGIDLSRHASRQLDGALVDAAYLIVVMTNAHKDTVLRRFPEARSRVFLLKSFGAEGRDEDIEDPFGMSFHEYQRVRDEMDKVMPDLLLYLHEWTTR